MKYLQRKAVFVLMVAALTAAGPLSADGNGPTRLFAANFSARFDNFFSALSLAGADFQGSANVPKVGTLKVSGDLFLDLVHSGTGDAHGRGRITVKYPDGDLLTAVFTGTCNIKTGKASGTLMFTGGTGAWALANGTGTFTAEIDVGSKTHQKMTFDVVGGVHLGPGL
jgi:hypothetical protein